MVVYLDTSAVAKLLIREPETSALRAWLATRAPLVTADLTRTELRRAVRRVRPEAMAQARAVLSILDLRRVTVELWERAGVLDPVSLRSLDAIHLAVALDLGDELDALVTYDVRLAEAAAGYGLTVAAPG